MWPLEGELNEKYIALKHQRIESATSNADDASGRNPVVAEHANPKNDGDRNQCCRGGGGGGRVT